MANDFIQKELMKERTGANVSPIQVDTQSRYLLNPESVAGVQIKSAPRFETDENIFLNTLEKIAKESEQLKLANEKAQLDLDLKQMDIDYESQWQEKNRYSSDNYETYLKGREELLSAKKDRVNKFKYYTGEQKNLFIKNLDVDHQEQRMRGLGERHKVYIKEATEQTSAILEQQLSLAGNLSLKDDKQAVELYKNMSERINMLKDLSGMSDEEAQTMLGKYLFNAENSRLQNELENIISNPSMPTQEKQFRLNNIKNHFSNNDVIKENAEELLQFFNGEDKEFAKQYLIDKATDVRTKTLNTYVRNINALAKQEKAEARAMERERKHREKIAIERDKLEHPENYTEASKAFKKLYKRNPTMEDIKMGRLEYDWEKLADFENTDLTLAFNRKDITKMKERVENLVEQHGYNEVDANNTVKEEAEKIFGKNSLKAKAFVKQYAETTNTNMTALYYGDVDPYLYETTKIDKNKGVTNNQSSIKINATNNWKPWRNDNKDTFNDMSKKISSDPIRGDEILSRAITARMLASGIKDFNETNVNEYLENKINLPEEQAYINSYKKLKNGDYKNKVRDNKNTINNKAKAETKQQQNKVKTSALL